MRTIDFDKEIRELKDLKRDSDIQYHRTLKDLKRMKRKQKPRSWVKTTGALSAALVMFYYGQTANEQIPVHTMAALPMQVKTEIHRPQMKTETKKTYTQKTNYKVVAHFIKKPTREYHGVKPQGRQNVILREIFDRYRDNWIIEPVTVFGQKYKWKYSAYMPWVTKKPPKEHMGFVLLQNKTGDYFTWDTEEHLNLYLQRMDELKSRIRKRDIPMDDRGRDYPNSRHKKNFLELLDNSAELAKWTYYDKRAQ